MDEEVIEQVLAPSIGQVLTPAQAMRLAIHEARQGAGYVAPNPLVGCVIVDREHRLLAVGFHRKVGHDHAEVDALKKLADPSRLEGCHVYVTLEPCAHQGRTPSCARTLAPLKPATLTYAVEDPFPLVAGKGAQILRDAGVSVFHLSEREDLPEQERVGLVEAAEDLAEIFLHNNRAKEPFIAVKVASTLDGKMAFVSGESKWITGEVAREHVHAIRARYDAVAVGRNTFVADDPSLNVRHKSYPAFANRAVLFDPKGRTLAAMAQSNLLKVRGPEAVIVVTEPGEARSNPAGVRTLEVPVAPTGGFVMTELLAGFRSEGLTSVMLEGGAHTFGAFFDAGKVRRLHAYLAPTLFGGRHGVSWSRFFGGSRMVDRICLERSERELLGEDLYWTARVRTVSTSEVSLGAVAPGTIDPHAVTDRS